eukprot:m.429967 g.429967  ORF g.429967 m.429967 type:complete len:77 (+) comp17098_c0_seq1:1853-2083(+)
MVLGGSTFESMFIVKKNRFQRFLQSETRYYFVRNAQKKLGQIDGVLTDTTYIDMTLCVHSGVMESCVAESARPTYT